MSLPLSPLPTRAGASSTTSGTRRRIWLIVALALLVVAIAVPMLREEADTSRLQARYFSAYDQTLDYRLVAGPSPSIHFPQTGPYDQRLGYATLPEFEQRLSARGFVVTAQARESARMAAVAGHGLFPPYQEKDQAGLMLLDAGGRPLLSTRYPARVYDRFESIPPVLVDALLFIEDRNLLDARAPERNPAIDWTRFGHALLSQSLRIFYKHEPSAGGSTLATQIEKFRHSPGGRTGSPAEKLRQIASASLRAYLGGPQTLAARQQIVVHYMNAVPLAAVPGIGEISGLGDGLADWYGRDFDQINRLLTAPESPATLDDQALAFKQALSLMIAQRAPSFYLRRNPAALNRLTNSYLRLLAADGIVSNALRDRALALPLVLQPAGATVVDSSFVARKAVSAQQASLLDALGMHNVYDLERLDLTARSTLDGAVQQAVSERLLAVRTPQGARAAGLYGFEMLRDQDDPSQLAYSFTLFEQRGASNLLRVQTDSLNQPFDINQGARLNLGSTAKLRTVITYLQAVSELHQRYAALNTTELRAHQADQPDPLSAWALDYLAHTSDRALAPMLNAAVERTYSASPGETFYTGGGAQTFSNFDADDNHRIMTVHQAFQHSVNLVFVRLMRDIVRYRMAQIAGPSAHWLTDPDLRHAYLLRFADGESRVYVRRFYVKYHGRAPSDALTLLLQQVRPSPPRIATVLRSVRPDASDTWFQAQLLGALKGRSSAQLSPDDMDRLYVKYGANQFSLNDRAYISGVHPLELWVVDYLYTHPDASENEVQAASRDARLTTYAWLFKSHFHAIQDRRIKRMIELQVYQDIGKSWNALGYPFATLTPSLASAIGASGDRPAALASLIGVVVSDGQMLPLESMTDLEFAAGTPYETHFAHKPGVPSTGLSPDIVAVVHHLLRDVVLDGTAKRLADGLHLPGGPTLAVYGKTGTGDQRFNVYAPGARLIESRKVNRSATFVFAIGSRFFGTLTAYVHEPYAARYDFTSALAVQLLKAMAPDLEPLLAAPQAPDRPRAPDSGNTTALANSPSRAGIAYHV